MASVMKCDLPDKSLLKQYATQTNSYADCFTVDIPDQTSLERYIYAFYTTPLFKLERFVLKYAASTPSTDQDAKALAAHKANNFALWRLVGRTDTEILLNAGRTSSWLRVEPQEQGTRLYFGTAVTSKTNAKTGKTEMGFLFSALLGFHTLYSRALLSAAKRNLA